MIIKKKNLITLIENYFNEERPIIYEVFPNPLVVYLMDKSNALAGETSAAGNLSMSGLGTAASEAVGGILSDFISMKADAALRSKHITRNSFDKYFHAMGFCVTAMNYTLETIKEIKNIGARSAQKDQIVKDIIANLRDAGQWKEALYDGVLGLGESSADDLEANSYGLSQVFNPNWRENIYNKFVPVLKPSGYYGYIKGNKNYAEPHYDYIYDSSFYEVYKSEFKKAESGKDFKFIQPVYNCMLSPAQLDQAIAYEKSAGKRGGFTHNPRSGELFKEYTTRQYNVELNKLLSESNNK